jgi:hypothetical protein
MKPKAKEMPGSRAEIGPTAAIETTITLDAVARVALHFLHEQDEHDKSRRKEVPKDTWPEIRAIREAIEFLNRCASLLSADADWKQRDVAAAKIAAMRGLDLQARMPFNDAVKFICSEPRLPRAEQYYSEFVRHEMGFDNADDAAHFLRIRREYGITVRQAIAERESYEAMCRTGVFPRRRLSEKK